MLGLSHLASEVDNEKETSVNRFTANHSEALENFSEFSNDKAKFFLSTSSITF